MARSPHSRDTAGPFTGRDYLLARAGLEVQEAPRATACSQAWNQVPMGQQPVSGAAMARPLRAARPAPVARDISSWPHAALALVSALLLSPLDHTAMAHSTHVTGARLPLWARRVADELPLQPELSCSATTPPQCTTPTGPEGLWDHELVYNGWVTLGAANPDAAPNSENSWCNIHLDHCAGASSTPLWWCNPYQNGYVQFGAFHWEDSLNWGPSFPPWRRDAAASGFFAPFCGGEAMGATSTTQLGALQQTVMVDQYSTWVDTGNQLLQVSVWMQMSDSGPSGGPACTLRVGFVVPSTGDRAGYGHGGVQAARRISGPTAVASASGPTLYQYVVITPPQTRAVEFNISNPEHGVDNCAVYGASIKAVHPCGDQSLMDNVTGTCLACPGQAPVCDVLATSWGGRWSWSGPGLHGSTRAYMRGNATLQLQRSSTSHTVTALLSLETEPMGGRGCAAVNNSVYTLVGTLDVPARALLLMQAPSESLRASWHSPLTPSKVPVREASAWRACDMPTSVASLGLRLSYDGGVLVGPLSASDGGYGVLEVERADGGYPPTCRTPFPSPTWPTSLPRDGSGSGAEAIGMGAGVLRGAPMTPRAAAVRGACSGHGTCVPGVAGDSRNGRASASVAKCACDRPWGGHACDVEQQCRLVAPGAHARVSAAGCSTAVRGTCAFECLHGFVPEAGAAGITCNTSYEWSDAPLACTPGCTARVISHNEVVQPGSSCASTGTRVGDNCNVMCAPGFIAGSPTAVGVYECHAAAAGAGTQPTWLSLNVLDCRPAGQPLSVGHVVVGGSAAIAAFLVLYTMERRSARGGSASARRQHYTRLYWAAAAVYHAGVDILACVYLARQGDVQSFWVFTAATVFSFAQSAVAMARFASQAASVPALNAHMRRHIAGTASVMFVACLKLGTLKLLSSRVFGLGWASMPLHPDFMLLLAGTQLRITVLEDVPQLVVLVLHASRVGTWWYASVLLPLLASGFSLLYRSVALSVGHIVARQQPGGGSAGGGGDDADRGLGGGKHDAAETGLYMLLPDASESELAAVAPPPGTL